MTAMGDAHRPRLANLARLLAADEREPPGTTVRRVPHWGRLVPWLARWYPRQRAWPLTAAVDAVRYMAMAGEGGGPPDVDEALVAAATEGGVGAARGHKRPRSDSTGSSVAAQTGAGAAPMDLAAGAAAVPPAPPAPPRNSKRRRS